MSQVKERNRPPRTFEYQGRVLRLHSSRDGEAISTNVQGLYVIYVNEQWRVLDLRSGNTEFSEALHKKLLGGF